MWNPSLYIVAVFFWLRYLGSGAVRLPVELWIWEHVEAHIADPSGHLMFPQQKEDLCQKVQGERIAAGQVYGLSTQTDSAVSYRQNTASNRPEA